MPTVRLCARMRKLNGMRKGWDETMFDQLAEMIVNYVEVKKEDIKPESRFIEDLGFAR